MISRLSLHARLLLIAGATGIAALLFAAFAISQVLEDIVRQNLEEKLGAQTEILVNAVGDDARLNELRVTALPGFESSREGWGWRVEGPAGTWTGGEAFTEMRRGGHRHHGPGTLDWNRGRGMAASGEPLHIRQRELQTQAGPVRIVTAGPRRLVERPLRAAIMPLFVSLALLGLGLAVATWAQLRFGLQPVRLLRDAVANVRAGNTDRLPEDVPSELQPLAKEVNALIEQNAAGLAYARMHVANLAHGLKTPLATLSLQLARQNAPAETRGLVEQLDSRIAHHLRKARSGAVASGGRVHCDVREVIDDLVPALERIHADRAIAIESAIAPTLSVAVDRQDLEEMLGNLMDNALRHAARRVRVAALTQGGMATIIIEDDGLGLTENEIALVLQPGTRLDESSPGFGFGLSIVRELADLYNGSLELTKSANMGGLCAMITLTR